VGSEVVFESIQNGQGVVFLDSIRQNGEDNQSYLFDAPEKILEINLADDVVRFFSEIEASLSKGYYVAGWFSYELGYLFHEPLKYLLERRKPCIPLAWAGIYRRPKIIQAGTLIFDPAIASTDFLPQGPKIKLDVSRGEFKKAIQKIHEHIKRGETYQVNYTIRGLFDFKGKGIDLYAQLRNSQRVHYGAFLRAGALEILCLSPELFFKKRGEKIWSKPMKGTISRGSDSAKDRELEKFLREDEKNRAENVMIVDLIRNDLGMICREGTVKVPELFTIERYETLFQMISRVEGRIKEPFSWLNCFKALFPCGSITGAPKMKTMEIIASLETSPRGIYTGAIGFITPNGDACFNVAIRTIMLRDGIGVLGIGSGITIYSDPDSEYEETLLKAQFLGPECILEKGTV